MTILKLEALAFINIVRDPLSIDAIHIRSIQLIMLICYYSSGEKLVYSSTYCLLDI